jgi:hypothetical protein
VKPEGEKATVVAEQVRTVINCLCSLREQQWKRGTKFHLDLTWSLSRLHVAMDGMSTSTYKRQGLNQNLVAVAEL